MNESYVVMWHFRDGLSAQHRTLVKSSSVKAAEDKFKKLAAPIFNLEGIAIDQVILQELDDLGKLEAIIGNVPENTPMIAVPVDGAKRLLEEYRRMRNHLSLEFPFDDRPKGG